MSNDFDHRVNKTTLLSNPAIIFSVLVKYAERDITLFSITSQDMYGSTAGNCY